jgi:hypothetical protein
MLEDGTNIPLARLSLPKKDYSRIGEHYKSFLPKGDCLPRWYNMALTQKLPMFPHPKEAIDLYTTKMGRPVSHKIHIEISCIQGPETHVRA